MISSFRRTVASLGVAASLALLACSSAAPAPAPRVALSAPPAPAPPPKPTRTRVLMINGGGNPSINYQSHLLHLEQLHELLLRAGVSTDQISVLASDGSNPASDLATRELQPEDGFWRLQGTRLQQRLRMPVTTVDSKLGNVTLEPATKARLTTWFDEVSHELSAGDTLLIYVTDHGTRNGPDPLDNRITLWGDEEWISVREFGVLVEKLHQDVRVVTLMSQCFSGAFAELGFLNIEDGEPTGNVCGYFASTADRPAYGCYPENRGKENIGYGFEFMRALERTGRFQDAHEAVIVDDATPDVPLRTSDVYLESLLRRDAAARRVPFEARVDELLREAFQQAGVWEADTRQLDHIGQVTGSFSPRSLRELDDLAKRLPEIDQQLTLVDRAWGDALADANASNLDRFIGAHPDWKTGLGDQELLRMDPATARSKTSSLLRDLAAFTMGDPGLEKRINSLKARGDDAKAASYRMQVRLAVVLRMRNILISIAGRQYLNTAGTPTQRTALGGFLACEDLTFPALAGSPPTASTSPASISAYPPFDADVKLTRDALPGFLGIRFKDPSEEQKTKQKLPPGASVVALVYPDSPAQKAGLEAGDFVLGPPGEPFTARNQIRAWTMLSEIGKPSDLEILHGGKRKRVAIVPDPFPVKWPALPGPVQVGAVAPKLDLKAYRGAVAAQTRPKQKYLLYFWATWCGPCKAAIPELLAFEKEMNIPVIAVTDEEADTLNAFIKKNPQITLPKSIAMDPLRHSFVAYGVSGTPTFVLVDEQGKVSSYVVGYTPRGLALPGWQWSGRGAAPGARP